MIIYFASDHAGFELKENIKKFLADSGYEVKDFGAFSLNLEDDYPDFIKLAAEAVSRCEQDSPSTGLGQTQCRGIVFGGSGQGEAMVANRYKGVRAAVYYGPASAKASSSVKTSADRSAGKGSLDIVKLSREHNNANILSLGARFVTEKEALAAVKLWLETSFSQEPRHLRRLAKF